jgi:GTP-binding protein
MKYNSARFVASYGTSKQLPPSKHPEVAFVGRSNVGKSSLMNKLFGRKGLVKVSQKPGKTTTVNFFAVQDVDFVDLPGYGYAQVSKSERSRWRELIEGYFTQERHHALTVALVDIRHDASPLDIDMIGFLRAHEIPFIIAFTKADKLKSMQRKKQVQTLCKQLAETGDAYFVVTSAEKGDGIEDLRAIIEDAVSQELASRTA